MHELLLQILFYIFAGLALLTALMVIIQSNPVRSVLFLVATFITTAFLWIMADAEFLSLILILVYVGAVMTLFLFVVMMLNIDLSVAKKHVIRYFLLALVLISLLISLLLIAIPKGVFNQGIETSSIEVSNLIVSEGENLMLFPKPISNAEKIGLVLYTDYVFAFEIASVILLVAIISAITLVHRKAVHVKQQSIVKQIMTRPEDRIRLVKMNSEKDV